MVTPHMLEALARAHEVKIVGGGQACQALGGCGAKPSGR